MAKQCHAYPVTNRRIVPYEGLDVSIGLVAKDGKFEIPLGDYTIKLDIQPIKGYNRNRKRRLVLREHIKRQMGSTYVRPLFPADGSEPTVLIEHTWEIIDAKTLRFIQVTPSDKAKDFVKRIIRNRIHIEKKRESKSKRPRYFYEKIKELVTNPEAETKAQNSLRDMISEDEFKRYLKRGFVVVEGKYRYVISPLSSMVRAYDINKAYQKPINDGVLSIPEAIAEFCIHTDENTNVPPSDHVINMMRLIQLDENEFLKTANKSNRIARASLIWTGPDCYWEKSVIDLFYEEYNHSEIFVWDENESGYLADGIRDIEVGICDDYDYHSRFSNGG